MEHTLGLLGGNGSSGLSSNESKVEALGQEHVGMATPNPEDTELELGLSLGGGVKVKPSAGAWGECGRILTAKDFPSVPSHGSSAPPRFSSAAVSGTKRPADSSPQEGGSPPRSSQVVGWPPIRAYRMNSLVNQAKNSKDEEDKAIDGKERSKDALKNIHNEQNNNTITLKARRHNGFVKVNMDGIPIGRKVDLNAHACYSTLAQTLEDMFFNPTTTSLLAIESKEIQMKLSKLLDGSAEFVLTYEDKEDDWMLVGDVPWRMFVSTVKRLRIMKTSEANGLAPTVQDKSEKQRIKPI